jgi:hypothetical protein
MVTDRTLSGDAADALATQGFVVVPGPFAAPGLHRLQEAYDAG